MRPGNVLISLVDRIEAIRRLVELGLKEKK
jgi:hypothetical protein